MVKSMSRKNCMARKPSEKYLEYWSNGMLEWGRMDGERRIQERRAMPKVR
jgi:hypothetical protein